MANKRNPSSNSIRQALLDLADLGYGEMTIKGAIAKIGTDTKLAIDLQNKWNAHAYPERAITWTQLTKDQRVLSLSSDALKVLVTMGMYCNQSGLIQARRQDLVVITGIKLSALKAALKELVACGAITIYRQSVRHEAPIYCVNPNLLHKGQRSNKQAYERFNNHLQISPAEYIIRHQLDIVAITDTVYREEADVAIALNRLTVTKNPPDPDSSDKKKAPHDGDTSAEGITKNHQSQNTSPTRTGQEELNIPTDDLSELDWMEHTNHDT